MDMFRVSHIPVVNDGNYIGLVSDKFIYDLNLTETPVDKEIDKFDSSHIHSEQHIFEAGILMYKLKLSVLPVLKPDHTYLGAITLYDLARRFAKLFSLTETGGVIILDVNIHDYSMTQISRIMDMNDARILSFFLNQIGGTNQAELILKLDRVDLSSIIESLNRFDYRVKSVYLDHSMVQDLYMDRYDLFMKYMNI